MSVSTAAILVLAMGFSVDYAAHIAEGLSTRARESLVTREQDAAKVTATLLCSTGVSVLHGGTSTLLAVLLLAFSDTKGFQDIFKCFFLMVLFGLLHGLVLLPSLYIIYSQVRRWAVGDAQVVNVVAPADSDPQHTASMCEDEI